MSTTPYTPTPSSSYNASAPQTPGTQTPAGRGRPRGAAASTGAKRGRKPRGGASGIGTTSPRVIQDSFAASTTTFSAASYPHLNWALPTSSAGTEANQASTSTPGGTAAQSNTPTPSSTPTIPAIQTQALPQINIQAQPQAAGSAAATPTGVTPTPISFTLPASSTAPTLDTTGLLTMPSVTGGTTLQATAVHAQPATTRLPGMDDDGEGDDELLPAMADDDYSAQLSWQSQSKENLK